MLIGVGEAPIIRDGRAGDVEAMRWARSDAQRDEWRHHLERAQSGECDFLVIELGGRIVGKAVLDWTRSADGTPWLWLGSVDPEHRSRGLGALGLAEAERRARERGHRRLEMCVDDDNPRARDLYLRSRGLGALGLAEAERRARGRGHRRLEMCVDDDNPRARDLYLRSGYAVVGPYVDEHDETRPDGTVVHVASPGVLLRKEL